jgi:hypothetical protein
MEIRLKFSYSGVLLFAIVTVGFIVAGFLYSPAFWIFAGLFGIYLVLFVLVEQVIEISNEFILGFNAVLEFK